MKNPSSTKVRSTRLRRRIRQAERMIGIGVVLMVMVSLLRTAQAVPSARADVLCEWLACAATVTGWVLLGLGLRESIRAVIKGLEHNAWPQKVKPVPHDNPSLHQAVMALAKQTKSVSKRPATGAAKGSLARL